MSTPENLAPSSFRSSCWIVVFYNPEEGTQWLDRVFADPLEALEEAAAEARPDDKIKLVQVVLDPDTPGRWADDVARRVEALVDEDAPRAAQEVVAAVLETLRDYEPQTVGELPEASLDFTPREAE